MKRVICTCIRGSEKERRQPSEKRDRWMEVRIDRFPTSPHSKITGKASWRRELKGYILWFLICECRWSCLMPSEDWPTYLCRALHCNFHTLVWPLRSEPTRTSSWCKLLFYPHSQPQASLDNKTASQNWIQIHSFKSLTTIPSWINYVCSVPEIYWCQWLHVIKRLPGALFRT